MKLMMRIRDFIGKPNQKVATLLPELLRLRTDLRRIRDYSPYRPLDAIVEFFNVVSQWHDRQQEIGQSILALQEVNHGQYEELISQLQLLRNHACSAGRDAYGWNRTKKDEVVTDDKVFLGNIFGLFTLPVSKWKQGKDEEKGGWGFSGMEHLSPYDVVSNQALKFMRSHIQPICDIIDQLENCVEVRRKVA